MLVPAERAIAAPLARLQLDGVDERTDGDVGQRQGVAGLDVGVGAAHDGVAHAQALRMKDVALLAVCVVQKGDAGGAVRIVLDGSHLGRHAVLVALEVDDAVAALVAAALMAGGDAPVVVAPSLLRQRREQSSSPALSVVISAKSETVWKRRPGLVGLYCLTPILTFPSCGEPLMRRSLAALPSRASPRTEGPLCFSVASDCPGAAERLKLLDAG